MLGSKKRKVLQTFLWLVCPKIYLLELLLEKIIWNVFWHKHLTQDTSRNSSESNGYDGSNLSLFLFILTLRINNIIATIIKAINSRHMTVVWFFCCICAILCYYFKSNINYQSTACNYLGQVGLLAEPNISLWLKFSSITECTLTLSSYVT